MYIQKIIIFQIVGVCGPFVYGSETGAVQHRIRNSRVIVHFILFLVNFMYSKLVNITKKQTKKNRV